MNDPFKNDPLVKRLDESNRKAKAQNWNDERKAYNRGIMDPEHIPPCDDCGCDVIAIDGFSWCCAECGKTRYVPRFYNELGV